MYRYNLIMEKSLKRLTHICYMLKFLLQAFFTLYPSLFILSFGLDSETDVTEIESAVMKDSVLQVKCHLSEKNIP